MLLFILTICIVFSGCIEGNNVAHSNESVYKGPVNVTLKNQSSITLSSEAEYLPEIEVRSFSSVYIYSNSEKSEYNITKKYYAVYNLSITNNGSKNLDFKLNELNVRDGDGRYDAILKPTNELVSQYSYRNEILSDFEKETKIEDKTLSPGQTINGSVVFQVNSLYNESFILMYNETPITSESFEKNIRALKIAESYNYSPVFGIPPYNDFSNGSVDLFEPNPESYPCIFPNWVNRSVFEYFNKADSDDMLKYPSSKIPQTDIVYALKVIPERNVTMHPKSSVSQHLLYVDDTGEELINASSGNGRTVTLNPQTSFSNATLVIISYKNMRMTYGPVSFINQDLILDDKLNLIVAKYYCGNYIS
jgi:hypothetical protein